MASDLSSDTDPDLLQKVADFFISNYQYDRAVDVLATAGKVIFIFYYSANF